MADLECLQQSDNSIAEWLADYCAAHRMDQELEKIFRLCFMNTFETTTQLLGDGTTYVFTGDIPAMWLRDSSAQVSQYISLASAIPFVRQIIKGLIKRQVKYILIDPYANAFNKEANGKGHKDVTKQSDWIWERKYEIDSLCYPVWLAYNYYKETNDLSVFSGDFVKAAGIILETFRTEQHHSEKSDYSFIRFGQYAYDTLENNGKGAVNPYCGMTWSAFRPSDDRCKYGYLVPSNQFAVVILNYLVKIFKMLSLNTLAVEAASLAAEIEKGIKLHGITEHPQYGKIYAYETDGAGNYNLMDDANVPSLLSLPYLGYCSADDEIYMNTRRFVLSKDNPYFFSGTAASGIGSPHTPKDYIWHIGITMQGLTSTDNNEKLRSLKTLLSTHNGTNYMHEGFHKDNPAEFTRPWFAWANSLFSVFVMRNIELFKK